MFEIGKYIMFFFISTKVSSLSCYQGSKDSGSNEGCDANLDRCVTKKYTTISVYSCMQKSVLDLAGATDGGCKEVNTVKTCVCSTDNCNDPNQASSGSTSSGKLL